MVGDYEKAQTPGRIPAKPGVCTSMVSPTPMNRIAHRQLALQRLKWVQAKEAGLSYFWIGRRFGISPSTARLWYLRWIESGKRFDSLYNRKHGRRSTPPNVRKDIEADLRALYKSGLRSRRLQKALKRRGHTVAVSTIYSNIKRLGLSTTYHRKPRRKPSYKTMVWPLGWVQADTMWPWGLQGPVQYTAVECASRVRFLCLYPEANEEYAADFVRRALLFFPIPVVMWHTDGGSEWTESFGTKYRTAHKVFKVLYEANISHHIVVGRPQNQGRVERSHRIDRDDFYRVFDQNTAIQSLPEWNQAYNESRTHGGIAYLTPKQELERLLDRSVKLDYSLCRF